MILPAIRTTFLLASLVAGSLHAATPAESVAARDTRMAWWREARFGMFVHWGLYSGLAGTWNGKPVSRDKNLEHSQRVVNADTCAYAAQAIPKFQPKKDFATAWAHLAKQAGCSYVVFTTKHHEGFALHDSKLTQYDAGDILNRDLVKEITDALRAEGLKVGFYHSLIDWHHPQYDYTRAKYPPYPEDGKRLTIGPRNHQRYIEYLHGQVDELLSNYGQVDVIWWDYSSIGFDGDAAWEAGKLISMCRSKQPQILMNNRLFRRPESGHSIDGGADLSRPLPPEFGDFATPEQHIPGKVDPRTDWETCMTLNNTWGYSEHDHNWKSAETITRNLIDIASKGGNYLLNIGPTGDGSIPKESVDCLTKVGEWMKTNAEAIRGTTASPLEKAPFDGRITTKGAIHYAHLFSRPESGRIELPFPVTKATLLADGSKLNVVASEKSTTIDLPTTLPDPVATVIRME
ncbi:MAG TPA: alpha-L-fucosidase [Luteolibacter sp.]|nr:alpha-L-fucosidase [Luteolibacter sp.]